MKQNPLKGQLLLLLAFFVLSLRLSAQDEVNTGFINRMNYVVAPLEKQRVPYGLLIDYAMEFANLNAYNGVLTTCLFNRVTLM